eukprot:580606-Pelagomonas_calceolata.AAC.1
MDRPNVTPAARLEKRSGKEVNAEQKPFPEDRPTNDNRVKKRKEKSTPAQKAACIKERSLN